MITQYGDTHIHPYRRGFSLVIPICIASRASKTGKLEKKKKKRGFSVLLSIYVASSCFPLEHPVGRGPVEHTLGNGMPRARRARSPGRCYIGHEITDTPGRRGPGTHSNQTTAEMVLELSQHWRSLQ